MSLSSGDEVPHIFTRKSRLQPGESLITSAIRLLQQYLPIPDSCTAANSILFDDLVGAGEQRRWHVERDSQDGTYGTSHQPHYSGLMPASLITLAHFSVSSAMNLPNFAGVIECRLNA